MSDVIEVSLAILGFVLGFLFLPVTYGFIRYWLRKPRDERNVPVEQES